MYAIVHSCKVRLILPQSNPYATLSQGQKCPLQPRIQYKVEISVPVRDALPWILLVAEMALLIINGKVLVCFDIQNAVAGLITFNVFVALVWTAWRLILPTSHDQRKFNDENFES